MGPDLTVPLVARLYGERPGDYQEIVSWWENRGQALPETLLPPLGVVIEKQGEMVAALWCYESFGVGVAFLDFPCTKPGIWPGLAYYALAMAEHSIVTVLRQKGAHKLLRCYTTPEIARGLERVGYIPAGDQWVGMMRRID